MANSRDANILQAVKCLASAVECAWKRNEAATASNMERANDFLRLAGFKVPK